MAQAESVQTQTSLRIVLDLNGTWRLATGASPTEIPALYPRKVTVPGLVGETVNPAPYYWYRRDFRVAERRASARLSVGKPHHGAAVWLNGRTLGESPAFASDGWFEATAAIDWRGQNVLLVRIDAPAVGSGRALPSEPGRSDAQGPSPLAPPRRPAVGIFDSVRLVLADPPLIEAVQVAPRLRTSDVVVQTRLRNRGQAGVFRLGQTVKTWKTGQRVGEAHLAALPLQAGEEKVVTQVIATPGARWWSPADPFLHVLETTTDGDQATTRFGMREFRGDPTVERYFLNHEVCYLRGGSVSLPAFLEDPRHAAYPWDQRWVRRFLGEWPLRMHWNCLRFCEGPAPESWLEMADEIGLLIQHGVPSHPPLRGTEGGAAASAEPERVAHWMRDAWNHPSVVIWGATGETWDPRWAQEVIPTLRTNDLSQRPWGGPNALPVRVDRTLSRGELLGRERGLPTLADRPPGDLDSIEPPGWGAVVERNGLNLDALAMEYWRASRRYAGVLLVPYLGGGGLGATSRGPFRDVRRLELEPDVAEALAQAGKPLGVYVDFWGPPLQPGSEHRFRVVLVNDRTQGVSGQLTAVLTGKGGWLWQRVQQPFALDGLDRGGFEVPIRLPDRSGEGELTIRATPSGRPEHEGTVSRRTLVLRPDP